MGYRWRINNEAKNKTTHANSDIQTVDRRNYPDVWLPKGGAFEHNGVVSPNSQASLSKSPAGKWGISEMRCGTHNNARWRKERNSEKKQMAESRYKHSNRRRPINQKELGFNRIRIYYEDNNAIRIGRAGGKY